MISQKTLKQQLHYCPQTGLFTWLVANSNRLKVGDVAGHKDARGYVQIGVHGKGYRAHRLAFLYMEGEFPPEHVDHINHIRDDNRWANLRHATNKENNRNSPMNKKNTSGFVGVSFHKAIKKWAANITLGGKQKHLGYFDDKKEAINVRKAANIRYGFHKNHGERFLEPVLGD
jgi:hypothetical protein